MFPIVVSAERVLAEAIGFIANDEGDQSVSRNFVIVCSFVSRRFGESRIRGGNEFMSIARGRRCVRQKLDQQFGRIELSYLAYFAAL